MLCNEFDPDRLAVINPEEHHISIPGFPQICMGIFSKPILEGILERFGGEKLVDLNFCTGPVPVYRVKALGQEFALFLPHVGGPSAGSMVEELAVHGARCFVFFGSCGVLRGDIADGHLIIPTAAIRDEGFSYHYLPPADEVELDPACVEACRQAMEALGLPYVEGKTWTTDAFYRETRGKMARRKEQGCLCVEMECASLAAVAQFRGVRFAEFFFAADNLDAPEWDARGLSLLGQTVGDQCFAAAVETGKRLLELH